MSIEIPRRKVDAGKYHMLEHDVNKLHPLGPYVLAKRCVNGERSSQPVRLRLVFLTAKNTAVRHFQRAENETRLCLASTTGCRWFASMGMCRRQSFTVSCHLIFLIFRKKEIGARFEGVFALLFLLLKWFGTISLSYLSVRLFYQHRFCQYQRTCIVVVANWIAEGVLCMGGLRIVMFPKLEYGSGNHLHAPTI